MMEQTKAFKPEAVSGDVELPALDAGTQEDMVSGHHLFWELARKHENDWRSALVWLCKKFCQREAHLGESLATIRQLQEQLSEARKYSVLCIHCGWRKDDLLSAEDRWPVILEHRKTCDAAKMARAEWTKEGANFIKSLHRQVDYAEYALAQAQEQIKKLTDQGEWINVTERMPNDTRGVLVWCPERMNIYCCNWIEYWSVFGRGYYRLQEKVTHWRPLPDPPSKPESEAA